MASKRKKSTKHTLDLHDAYRLTRILDILDELDNEVVSEQLTDKVKQVLKGHSVDEVKKRYLWEVIVPQLEKQAHRFYGECSARLHWWYGEDSEHEDFDDIICEKEFIDLLNYVHPDESECNAKDCKVC